MAPVSNKTMVYSAVPETFPEAGKHVTIEDRPIDLEAAPLGGGILIKVFYATADPYMRGRMRDPKVRSYFPAFNLGAPIDSGIVGKVLRSETPEYQAGDIVAAWNGPNAQYAVIPQAYLAATGARKIENPHNLPLSYFIGFAGMPGTTVHEGLYEIANLKKGETIFVSSAAGVVGQLVGQVAKAEGLRVIGSAGSQAKVDFVKSLGFDEVFNYKEEPVADALTRLAPEGIDIYWDNVGEDHLEAALEAMNKKGRVIACGAIAGYNTPKEQRRGVTNLFHIVAKSIRMQGFIVDLSPPKYQAMLDKFGPWFASGKLQGKEDIYEGIEKNPEALVGLFHGKNFGKVIVKYADEE